MTKILIVDDSSADRRLVKRLLESETHPDHEFHLQVLEAEDGKKALDKVNEESPDLIITDLQMPNLNGLELVEKVMVSHPSVPVILMTAHGSEEIALQALRLGATSYIPKTRLGDSLVSTVEDVLAVAVIKKERQRLVEQCWLQTETNFLVPNDLEMIAPMIGHLQENLQRMQIREEHDLVRVNVALREALSNAIVHGNLEIGSELRASDDFAEIVESRRKQMPYKNRQVYVTAEESRSEAVYVVRDEGPGYDVNGLPDPTDPANLEKVSGRGLLLIRTFMDSVRFNDKGNEITMIKRRQ